MNWHIKGVWSERTNLIYLFERLTNSSEGICYLFEWLNNSSERFTYIFLLTLRRLIHLSKNLKQNYCIQGNIFIKVFCSSFSSSSSLGKLKSKREYFLLILLIRTTNVSELIMLMVWRMRIERRKTTFVNSTIKPG